MDAVESEALVQDGFSALARGDAAAAEAAADGILAGQPRHIPALVLKGDCLCGRGRDREAAVFYNTALRAASQAAAMTAASEAAARRAQQALAALQRRFEEHLERSLAASGFPAGRRPGRFEEAMEIVKGRRPPEIRSDAPFVQQPTTFFYPRLPQRQFYEPGEFPWLARIEAATAQIREELLSVLAQAGSFQPYMEQDPNGPANYNKLIGDPSWSAFFLVKEGRTVPGNAERCPRTVEALAEAPLPRIEGRAPNILFSLLRPGAHIPAHTGVVNTQLICHLPLIVPPGCRLRVGSETREWEEGKALVFDDSIEHEAWNTSSDTRVVLLFDIWRPELREDEKGALTALFSAVSGYGA